MVTQHEESIELKVPIFFPTWGASLNAGMHFNIFLAYNLLLKGC